MYNYDARVYYNRSDADMLILLEIWVTAYVDGGYLRWELDMKEKRHNMFWRTSSFPHCSYSHCEIAKLLSLRHNSQVWTQI